MEAAFRMAIAEDGVGGEGGGGDDHESARRLTVEDRADLWEWFEEFVEDLCMDVVKVSWVGCECLYSPRRSRGRLTPSEG